MDDNPSLFSLSIDAATKTHLFETARWARFLAVVGFVFLVLLIGMGVYSSLLLSRFEEGYRSSLGMSGVMNAAGMGVAVVYLIMAVVAFFPLLFTFRFASLMRQALNSNNQALLNASFQNLKVCFRYLGIITIISLVLMALTLVFGIAGLAAVS